ncbi:MAG: crotonase/enoyl-CoA hydratase family protein [Burkholderiales bacterium]
MTYETLDVRTDGAVATIFLNRPDKANAMNAPMWRELRAALQWLDETPAVRVGILRGAGRHFTAGIDLSLLDGMREHLDSRCGGRAREALRREIQSFQDTITAVERCRKPVIAAIHGPCIGGGVDLVTACDMRYCSAQATFSIREIDVGLTADVGTLQRLPRLIGEGMARELAYTGRTVSGREAREILLANRCYDDADALFAGVSELAATIAAKSPLSIRGTKEMITYARDHSVADALNYVATWNASMLISADLEEALRAGREKRPPVFED